MEEDERGIRRRGYTEICYAFGFGGGSGSGSISDMGGGGVGTCYDGLVVQTECLGFLGMAGCGCPIGFGSGGGGNYELGVGRRSGSGVARWENIPQVEMVQERPAGAGWIGGNYICGRGGNYGCKRERISLILGRT